MGKLADVAAGGVSGASAGVATSFLGGVALASQPVTVLGGLITVGTTTTVCWPVVGAFALGGAVVGALATHWKWTAEDRRIHDAIEDLLRGDGLTGTRRTA